MTMKKFLPVFLLILARALLIPIALEASSLYSPTWGFSLDLPEDYVYVEGDGRDRFSFETPDGACFDIVVYAATSQRPAPYASIRALANDVQIRLSSEGDTSFFTYQNNEAAILELFFPSPFDGGRSVMIGFGLALELEAEPGKPAPLLLALAYGPEWREDLLLLHLSALDSIAPTAEDRLCPGPITEFSFPRETRQRMAIWGLGEEAWFYPVDEEASQWLIEREFIVLIRYAESADWVEAWSRYYRAVYRDSYERLKDAAFVIERKLYTPQNDSREFAGRVLEWIQGFTYERDFSGSDFVSLVSAVLDGRGDCDSRAMLFALILNQANIPAAMMVSVEYSHAMGLVDLPGSGARFDFVGKQWLVAETTAQVTLGLIGADTSDPDYWLGIFLDSQLTPD